ncbi:MAG: hypothetical protein A2X94_12245 [Bdellovibrionales bacterium GWB1_55_8]|nr:MAG: hypothetical protein A2X94_12245 [Bdellovibrionales bacterium GWB1_55_8]
MSERLFCLRDTRPIKLNFFTRIAGRSVAGVCAASFLVACASPPPRSDFPLATAQENRSFESDLAEGKRAAKVAEKNSEASAEYHFSLAQAYVAEGNPDRAIEEYKLTLLFDPGSALVYARLATEYVKKGMLSDAMETCKEALQRDPKFVDARLMLAGLYLNARQDEDALREYEQVLKLDARHEEAAVYKAQALGEAGRSKEAAIFLRKFVKANPESALGWYTLARFEQALERVEPATQAYRKAIALRPGFPQASLALGYLYEEKGKNAQAMEIYRTLYDETQDLGAANRLATLLLKAEKYRDAVPYLETIEAADPEDMNARVKLGLIQMELKNYDRAIAIFENILAKAPNSDRIQYYLGSVYEETGKPEQAIKALRKIEPSSKLYPDAVLHVAYLLKEKESVAASRAYIDAAIETSPNLSSFYVFRASLDEGANDIAGAVAVLEKAVVKFSEDEKILYYLGSLYDRIGKVDQGLQKMEAILKVNPNNVDALNYIGYTWTVQGLRLNDAEKLLKRALALKPDNAYIRDSWGWYLFVRGKLGEAVVELEKAAQLKPDEATILEHLADAYLRKNLREKALARYTDAIRYAQDDSAKKKIEAKRENLSRELAETRSQEAAPVRMPASRK